MTVKELIAHLQQHNPDAVVIVPTYDGNKYSILTPGSIGTGEKETDIDNLYVYGEETIAAGTALVWLG